MSRKRYDPNCLSCGKSFTSKSLKGKYCSDKCRRERFQMQKSLRSGVKIISASKKRRSNQKTTYKENAAFACEKCKLIHIEKNFRFDTRYYTIYICPKCRDTCTRVAFPTAKELEQGGKII